MFVLFWSFFFSRDRVYLFYQKSWNNMNDQIELGQMLCQERFVFFCECYRQDLKELKCDLVMGTAV